MSHLLFIVLLRTLFLQQFLNMARFQHQLNHGAHLQQLDIFIQLLYQHKHHKFRTLIQFLASLIHIFIQLQMDPSLHTGALSGSNYVPPAAFGVGSVSEAFPTDTKHSFQCCKTVKESRFCSSIYFTCLSSQPFNFSWFLCSIMHPPPLPNWLREELLKKKSTLVSASVQHPTNSDSMESEDAAEPPK